MTQFFPDKFLLNSDVEPIRFVSRQKFTFEVPAGQWVGLYPEISRNTFTVTGPVSDFFTVYIRNTGTDDCGTIRLKSTGQWISSSVVNDPALQLRCKKSGANQFTIISEFSKMSTSGGTRPDAVWTISQKQTIEVSFNFLTSPFAMQ